MPTKTSDNLGRNSVSNSVGRSLSKLRFEHATKFRLRKSTMTFHVRGLCFKIDPVIQAKTLYMHHLLLNYPIST